MTSLLHIPPALRVVLSVAALVGSFILMSMSETTDEPAHIDYGRRVLEFQPARMGTYDDSKMPVTALNAVPLAIALALDHRGRWPRVAVHLRDVRWARVPTLAATLLLMLFVYRWSGDLYGESAAVPGAVMLALSPTVLAHGTLATTDLYFGLSVVMALYYLKRYLRDPTLKHAVVSAGTLAAAQITKPFALYLYGIAACFLVAAAVGPWREARPPRRVWRLGATYLGVAAFSFIVVLNVVFSFHRSFVRVNRYDFRSETFARLRQAPVVSSLPVPVPHPWLHGLDMVQANEQSGRSFGNIYLRGELREVLDPNVRGFKSYYLVALLYKTPIGLHVLIVLGLWYAWRTRHKRDTRWGEAILAAGAVVPLVWLSFFSRAQIGIRHILPTIAICAIFASAAFESWPTRSRRYRAAVYAFGVWAVISVGSYFPHMIPYMNEWVPDRTRSYTVLADSNLDWGQNAAIVRKFLERNPDVVFEPEQPATGRVLVSANALVGIAPRIHPNRMLWLRSQHVPVAHVGYAHLLFDVPPIAGALPAP